MEYKMEEELIKLVAVRPFLYERKDLKYKNNKLKDEAWREIANALGSDTWKVKRRWISLREQFCREYRNILSGSVKKFKHYESLLFLKDVYQPKNRAILNSIIKNENPLFLKTNKEEEDLVEYEIQTPGTASTTATSKCQEDEVSDISKNKSTATKSSSNKRYSSSNVNKQIIKFLKDTRRNQEIKNDDIEVFNRSLANTIRAANFNEEEWLDLKIDLLNFVREKIKNKKRLNY